MTKQRFAKNSEQNEVMKRLGASVYQLRQVEKMSIREFAEKIGVNHSDIFRLESGNTLNPSIFLIRKIAEAFGMTMDELMNFDAKPCPTCGGKGWVK